MTKASATATATVYSGTWASLDATGGLMVDTSTVTTALLYISYTYNSATYTTNEFTVAVTCAPYTAPTTTTMPTLTGLYSKNQVVGSTNTNTVVRSYATEIQPYLMGDTCSYCSSKKSWTLNTLTTTAGITAAAVYSGN